MKISVCMATYNGEKYILQQITSILKQLDMTDELIISDDNSQDRTVQMIKEIGDPRIVIIENKKNVGYSQNFERTLSRALGDYIFLSDQDDVWLDNKVNITLAYLQKYDFVLSDAKIVDAELNVISESRINKYKVKNSFFQMLIRSRCIGCCMAFNRNVLNVLFPFPKNRKWVPHDIWISLLSEMYFKSIVIPEVLILYRRHDTNASKGGENEHRRLMIKIISRIYVLWWLINRKKKIQGLNKKHE